MTTDYGTFLPRRGTTAQWAASSRVLLQGEFGKDTTTGELKQGNGVDLWGDLAVYLDEVTVATAAATPASPLGVALKTASDERSLMNGAAAIDIARIQALFLGGAGGVFLKAVDAAPGLSYMLIRGMGTGRFSVHELAYKTGAPGGQPGLNQLGKCYLALAMLSVDETDASVVRVGTWADTAQVLAYGGRYRYSVLAGNTITWATPVAATTVGCRVVKTSNGGGLAKVTIDGDATLANLLPTAAELVAAGTYANTILVANGGTLNPTDRVMDTYAALLNYDTLVSVADGLALATHTVVWTHTGYQRTAAVANRFYFSGVAYGGGAVTPATALSDMFPSFSIHNETSTASAWEYADEERPDAGGTLTFIGNIHGYERQDSLTLYSGYSTAPITMAAGDVVAPAVGGRFRIVRASTMFHPDSPAVATKTSVTEYLLDRQGLGVTSTITYLQAMYCDLAYQMMPGNGALSTTGVPMDRVALSAYHSVLALTGGSDSRYGHSRSPAAWMWSTAGKVGQLMWLPDVYGTLDGYAYSAKLLPQVQDRNGTLTKVYVPWIGGTGGPRTIPVGTVKVRSARYLAAYFPAGADAVLAAA